MASAAPTTERPGSIEEASELMRTLGEARQALRARGAGTKLAWDGRAVAGEVEVCTGELTRVLEHNEGDFTAVLEAGVPLAHAQEQFGRAGQMLALDPPLAPAGTAAEAATVGGVVATGDSGPLRHRYGGVRDLILGVTVVLSDGTVAKSGGRVIKNVAGYDLGKLFTGSEGTLGMIAAVSVRLHPRAEGTATACGTGSDPSILAQAALRLAALPLGAESLDVAWTPRGRCGTGPLCRSCGGRAGAGDRGAAEGERPRRGGGGRRGRRAMGAPAPRTAQRGRRGQGGQPDRSA